jgi:predicted dienelactone hydrolase
MGEVTASSATVHDTGHTQGQVGGQLKLKGPMSVVVCAVAALMLVPAAGANTSHPEGAARSISQVYRVASFGETFVDVTRPTPPNGAYPGSPERVLPTLVLYPKERKREHSQFPLIVFSHGFTASGPDYASVLRPWAAHGYVVAAPTFPLSSGNAPGGPTVLDYPNQPGDVSFVITRMLQLDQTAGSPLFNLIDPQSIGVAGHSLGAITTLGVADNSCCKDHRIDAAVSIAGIELPFTGGTFFKGHTSPLLLIHGTADHTVPYAASQVLFADARSSTFFLTLEGAPHTAFFDPWRPVITNTVLSFFDRYLKHSSNVHQILLSGTVPGVASIQFRLGQHRRIAP